MKKLTLSLILSVIGLSAIAQTKISEGPISNAHASAVLEVESSTKGFLPPRLTTGQRDLILNPANGLVIYNSTSGRINVFRNTQWYEASVGDCISGPLVLRDIINNATSSTWMDKNLGACQTPTSSTDALSYGDLYQWERRSDGHQIRNSATTSTNVSSNPNHGDFILGSNWYTGNDAGSRWVGISAPNNTCPVGYRLPTVEEFDLEFSSNLDPSYTSIKLTLGGYRSSTDGSLINVGINGYYWTSETDGNGNPIYYILSLNAGVLHGESDSGIYNAATGMSVRCKLD
jgi:hypothetical protein